MPTPGMGHVAATREETFVDDNGNTVSLGVQLTHLDLLIDWVEHGVDPADFISIDPSDTTKTLSVKGAHQLGLQKSPLKYFWAAPVLAQVRPWDRLSIESMCGLMPASQQN